MRAAVAVALVVAGCREPVTAKPGAPPLDTTSLAAITQGPGAQYALIGSPRALFTGAFAPHMTKLVPAAGLDKLQARLGFDLRAASHALMVGYAATTFYAAHLPSGTAPSGPLEAFEKRLIPPLNRSTPRPDLVRVLGDLPAGARGSAAGMWSMRGDAIVAESGRLGPVLVSMALAAGKLAKERALAHDKTFGPLLSWAGNAEISLLIRCPVARALGVDSDETRANVLLQECFGVGVTLESAGPGKLAIAARITGAWGKDASLAGDETRATIARLSESDLGRVLGLRDSPGEVRVTPEAIDATVFVSADTFASGLGRILAPELDDTGVEGKTTK